MTPYFRRDATIRELVELVKQAVPAARVKDVVLNFALIHPDQDGRTVVREIASAVSNKNGKDDNKTLDELHFEIGDFLDVAIMDNMPFQASNK